MELLKTDKDVLTTSDILSIIEQYEHNEVQVFNVLWKYYIGENETITKRNPFANPAVAAGSKFNPQNANNRGDIITHNYTDANTPNAAIPVPYGRKIVNTFSGYAYRPKYITYKPTELVDGSPTGPKNSMEAINNPDIESHYPAYANLMNNYNINNEHIKTSRAGRNTGIFGVSYELLYIDGEFTMDNKLPVKAEVKFFTVDPREMILLYDYSSEPKKKIAIRFYPVNNGAYKVEVYYKDHIEIYKRLKNDTSNQSFIGSNDWNLVKDAPDQPNFFNDIPVAAYYLGDERMGLIKPVIGLIDCYDMLISDSMNEFDRFANAYLIMKRFGITDPMKKKEPNAISAALQNLKRYRIMEHLDKDADIKFLTKDIPYGFIQFMTDLVKNQIHIQSHVPDFAVEKFSGASGIAIQRLLFDFENLVSSAEADFDTGLYERMNLIFNVYKVLGRPYCQSEDIVITHKRNTPLNVLEFAQTAQALKAAGFSSYLVTDFMPDDIVPNTEEELRRQEQDRENMMPSVEQTKKDSKGNPIGTLYDMTGAKSSFDEQGKPIGKAFNDKGEQIGE